MTYTEMKFEEKGKIIDKIARAIVKLDLDSVFILFLDTIRPASSWLVPASMVAGSPIMFSLEFFGIDSWEIGFLFSSPENIEALIKRIEELSKNEK